MESESLFSREAYRRFFHGTDGDISNILTALWWIERFPEDLMSVAHGRIILRWLVKAVREKDASKLRKVAARIERGTVDGIVDPLIHHIVRYAIQARNPDEQDHRVTLARLQRKGLIAKMLEARELRVDESTLQQALKSLGVKLTRGRRPKTVDS